MNILTSAACHLLALTNATFKRCQMWPLVGEEASSIVQLGGSPMVRNNVLIWLENIMDLTEMDTDVCTCVMFFFQLEGALLNTHFLVSA